jgi:hypothetical protein
MGTSDLTFSCAICHSHTSTPRHAGGTSNRDSIPSSHPDPTNLEYQEEEDEIFARQLFIRSLLSISTPSGE